MTLTNRPAFWLILALALTVLARGWLAREYVLLGDDTVYYLDYLRAERSEWWTHAVGAAYLWPFMLLGKYPGAWAAALVASVLPAIPLYLLARRVASAPAAILAAVLFAWMPTFGTLLASAWIVLLAITLGLASLHWLLRYCETRKGRYLALGLLCGLMVGFTSPSALLVFAPVCWLLLVYVASTEERRAEHMALWSSLLLLGSAFGIIIANIFLGYNFHFKSHEVAILGAMAAAAALYFGSRVQMPTGLIIISMGGWAGLMTMLTVGHVSFFGLGGLETVFGRTDLWILPAAMLVFTWGIGKADFSRHPRAAAIIGCSIIAGTGILWSGGFRAMAEDHSTLTWESLPIIAATAALPPEAIIGVHPHMLARHVEEYTAATVLHSWPEGLDWPWWVQNEDAQVRCAMSQAQACDPGGITYLLVKDGSKIEFRHLEPAESATFLACRSKHVSTSQRRDVAE